MPRYQVTIYYRNPGGQPQTFVDQVLAPDECIAAERAERVCRANRKVARIDGGDVYAVRAGKTVTPRDLLKTSAQRRVIVIVPDPGSTDANDLYDYLRNEFDNNKTKAAIFTAPMHVSAADMLTRLAATPFVAASPEAER